VVEIPRFLQVEWQTALEWYDATVSRHMAVLQLLHCRVLTEMRVPAHLLLM
jgi:hypothetical protein